jgi:hypothetical protein
VNHEGITIVDRCPSYGYIDDRNKQYCWSHLGRDITSIVDAVFKAFATICSALETVPTDIFKPKKS